MNFTLPHIPERTTKPRESGLTMMMDKGLSVREVENVISSCGHLVDLAKLGFGTSYISNNLKEKIKLYKQANIKVYLGGTLFEAFYVRGKFNDYVKLLDELGLELAEVSDGEMVIDHKEKCKCIEQLSKKVTVLSEVGSKEASVSLSNDKWISMMNAELEAGSWKVIAEARESGNVGIFNSNCSANTNLIDELLSKVPSNKIIWEAPNKPQQVWFIKQLGSNANLGNIASNEIIPLETLRLGLRGDTFFDFLPKEMQIKQTDIK